jgi:hypothetical protein
MTKFAKLFDTPHGQLLVTMLPNDGKTRIALTAEPLGDMCLTMGFEYEGGEGAERAQQIFNGYDQGKADHEAGILRSTAAMVMREDIK